MSCRRCLKRSYIISLCVISFYFFNFPHISTYNDLNAQDSQQQENKETQTIDCMKISSATSYSDFEKEAQKYLA